MMRERTVHEFRRRTSRYAISLSRGALARTPLRRLAITRRVHQAVFRFGCSADESGVCTTYRGLRLAGPDPAAVQQFFGGGYERVQLALFERLAAVSEVIVDVGANIGVYTCVGASRVPHGGRLIAFEPVPANTRFLMANAARNGLAERVITEAMAVGDEDGTATIYLSRKIGHHSLAAANAGEWEQSLTVPLISLDSYFQTRRIRPPDIIKVDTEGFDGHVLRGARRLIERSRPALFTEYAPSHLENCGFEPVEFLDSVFSVYPNVFLIRDRKVQPCVKSDVLRLTGTNRFHVDLLAVARPEHLELVRTAHPRMREPDRTANG